MIGKRGFSSSSWSNDASDFGHGKIANETTRDRGHRSVPVSGHPFPNPFEIKNGHTLVHDDGGPVRLDLMMNFLPLF
jgi:hypothetical protein